MAEKGEVEEPLVGFAVLAHDAAPVHGQDHRQVLQADVVEHLVVGPLHKGGVDGAHRLHALQGQPRGEGYRVLFTNAHIEKPFREALAEIHQAGAIGHGRGDGHDLGVFLGQAHQGVAKDFGVGRHLADTLLDHAGIGVEAAQAVKAGGVRFRRLIALALGGEDVHQNGAPQLLDVLQDFDEVIQAVAFHRPQVGEFEGLEEHTRGEEGL